MGDASTAVTIFIHPYWPWSTTRNHWSTINKFTYRHSLGNRLVALNRAWRFAKGSTNTLCKPLQKAWKFIPLQILQPVDSIGMKIFNLIILMPKYCHIQFNNSCFELNWLDRNLKPRVKFGITIIKFYTCRVCKQNIFWPVLDIIITSLLWPKLRFQYYNSWKLNVTRIKRQSFLFSHCIRIQRIWLSFW